MKEYKLTISPAIPPEERHEIEKTIKKLGYRVIDGGTFVDMSECNVWFEKDEGGKENVTTKK